MICLREFICDTSGDLPAVDTVRWTPRRRAMLALAVRTGRLSIPEACERYKFSVEELSSLLKEETRMYRNGNRVK